MAAFTRLVIAGCLTLAANGRITDDALLAQGQKEIPLAESGQVAIAGRLTPYLVRHLPLSSFPDLPPVLVDQLGRRGCLIPQTYEAHGPENVIHGSFARANSSDWAILCSVEGSVSLLVYFGDAMSRGADRTEGKWDGQPVVLDSSRETERMQTHDPSGVLGFDWAIDAASPQRVHEAQVGVQPRPARLDHDAVADSAGERRTVYHYFAKGAWSVLEMPN